MCSGRVSGHFRWQLPQVCRVDKEDIKGGRAEQGLCHEISTSVCPIPGIDILAALRDTASPIARGGARTVEGGISIQVASPKSADVQEEGIGTRYLFVMIQRPQTSIKLLCIVVMDLYGTIIKDDLGVHQSR